MYASVPKNAKCTDELPRTTKQDDRYDIFEQYVMAIWRFQRAVDKFSIGIQLKNCVRQQGIKRNNSGKGLFRKWIQT